MRIKEHVLETIRRRARESAEIATCLALNPDCMNGDPQKEKAYLIAIQYLKEKKEDCKKTKGVLYSQKQTIDFQVLIDCYEGNVGDTKKKYAGLIVSKLVETNEIYLEMISDEVKEEAFQIAIKHLEEQKDA